MQFSPRPSTPLACLTILFVVHANAANAQSFSGCSRLTAPNGSVTWICPPATAEGGRFRNGEFIPACPAGMAFRREEGRCIPLQNYGGVIPCSEDDKSFIQGRWVSNCR